MAVADHDAFAVPEWSCSARGTCEVAGGVFRQRQRDCGSRLESSTGTRPSQLPGEIAEPWPGLAQQCRASRSRRHRRATSDTTPPERTTTVSHRHMTV